MTRWKLRSALVPPLPLPWLLDGGAFSFSLVQKKLLKKYSRHCTSAGSCAYTRLHR